MWVAAGLAVFAALAMQVANAAPARSLVERLGFPAGTRAVIINGDDTGMCHAANTATFDSLLNGSLTTATVMVPCPWLPEVAAFARQNPKVDLGVHLTHTSEWVRYKWGPVAPRSAVPGLLDKHGYLWESVEEVYAHSTPAEAGLEARAQVKRAIEMGLDVTHVDSHMGTMQYDPKYHREYLKVAREFDLPLRMATQELYVKLGAPSMREDAAKLGLVFPDRLIHEEAPAASETRKAFWMRMLTELGPGVTELYIHASSATEESQATSNTWRERAEDYRIFTSDPDVRRLFDEKHIVRIGYRALRDLQRRERRAGGG